MVRRLIASGTSVGGMPTGTAPSDFRDSIWITPEPRTFLPLRSCTELSGRLACRLKGGVDHVPIGMYSS